MPWFQVVVFLLKYGLNILSLVRGIWELVDWIKDNDDKVSVSAKMMSQNLHAMAKRARASKDVAELQKMLDVLMQRKAEIEGGL